MKMKNDEGLHFFRAEEIGFAEDAKGNLVECDYDHAL